MEIRKTRMEELRKALIKFITEDKVVTSPWDLCNLAYGYTRFDDYSFIEIMDVISSVYHNYRDVIESRNWDMERQSGNNI